MPAIGKQRRATRNKVFRKRRDRFTGSSKPKPFTPLTGKLKNNNNLLAKALSAQKQETQLLFSEKVELTSQLQTLKMACNKRDLMFANVQKNAKEMLSMLVTMTNYVTNTIMCCQEFSHKADGTIPRTRSVSATRRDSSRRLSTKSPARGVVKPMVSGYTITKPTITLRRVNMPQVNDLMDLSIINEETSNPINNTTSDASRTHNAAFTSTSRLGYEGERRRRLPERIPVAYVESDDDEGETLGRQESRLSARFSGRISNSLTRKLSENTLTCQIRSPSVSLCDVSKLLQNSQTINVRMLQDSQGNGDFIRMSDTVKNFSQHINDEDSPSINIAVRKSGGARKSLDKSLKSPPARREVPTEKRLKTVKQTNKNLEVDPMEGPSWLLNGDTVNKSFQNEGEETVEIFRRKHIVRKLVSSESEAEAETNSDSETMEFTECVKPVQIRLKSPISQSVDKQTDVESNLPNRNVLDKVTGNNCSNSKYLDDLSNHSDEDEQCAHVAINQPNNFITDRRQRYVESDDEDDDTIMLKLGKATKPSKFDINDFRLPVLNGPIITSAEHNDSDPEVTTTIQTIPHNCVPPKLVDNDVNDRVSNIESLQLPKIDDELTPNTKKTKRPVKRKQPKKQVEFYPSDSSDSDCVSEHLKKKTNKTVKPNLVKDPSSAKVVLQKLNDTHMKITASNPDQSLRDKTQDLETTNHRTSDTGNSDLVTDSNSSTHSMNENNRPRRQKAPTNFKEPSSKKYVKNSRV